MSDFSCVIDDVACGTGTTTQVAVIKANTGRSCVIRVIEATQASASTSESSVAVRRSSGGTAGASVTPNPLNTASTTDAGFTVNKVSSAATLGVTLNKQVFPSNYGTPILKNDSGITYPGIILNAGEQATITYSQTSGSSVTPCIGIHISNYG